MKYEKPDRKVPLSASDKDGTIGREGLLALYVGRFQEAERCFLEQLKLRREIQEVEGRAIEKGAPFYNLGLSLVAQGRTEEGLRNILLAYIEDTLDTNYDDEDDAGRAFAAIFLRDAIRIKLRLLRELKAASRKAKADGLWTKTYDPADILREVVRSLSLDDANMIQYCEKKELPREMPLGFPQPRERRVFIGTNYDTHAHVIPPIKEAVLRKGYVPIIVKEVSFDPKETHDVSLLLLHTCKYAIFDITDPGGQFMEIERARDYGLSVQLVRSRPSGHPPAVSQMITSMGHSPALYDDPRVDFNSIVGAFLP
jgi:tetratricopeptide (TPR) repeat protein